MGTRGDSPRLRDDVLRSQDASTGTGFLRQCADASRGSLRALSSSVYTSPAAKMSVFGGRMSFRANMVSIQPAIVSACGGWRSLRARTASIQPAIVSVSGGSDSLQPAFVLV